MLNSASQTVVIIMRFEIYNEPSHGQSKGFFKNALGAISVAIVFILITIKPIHADIQVIEWDQSSLTDSDFDVIEWDDDSYESLITNTGFEEAEIGLQTSRINQIKTKPFHESKNLHKPMLLHNEDWLLSKNREHYVIQVIALNSKDQIKRFAKQHADQFDWAYFVKKQNNKDIFILVRCCFDSRLNAQAAMEKLPPRVKQVSPFLIKLDKIDSAIQIRLSENSI